jgi:acetylornithine/N-succinyldiaminopimelate aminotransferase
MTKPSSDFISRWDSALQANYGTPHLALVAGKGSVLTDSNGNRYLDFLGGIATNVLGHAHPAVVSAVSKQIATLGHVSNFYIHPGVVDLAEKLKALVGDESSKVFFCNSGAEANEAAFKLSRRTGKTKVIATEGAFHGRTMGALSLTGQPSKRNAFKPLVPGVTHVPFGDVKAMTEVIDTKTAMVIIEPMLGEAGVVVPPKGYLKAVRKMCDETGTLLVIDAVQTGMGRTGHWFGYEYEGITPDVITLAKGLGGGLPLGAMIALGTASDLFRPGDHGSTFGGNPVACASALAVIAYIEKKNLLSSVRQHESVIKKYFKSSKYVKQVRGQGLLLGFVLSRPLAVELRDQLESSGVLVNAPASDVIRIAPALTISDVQVQTFIKKFNLALEKVFNA